LRDLLEPPLDLAGLLLGEVAEARLDEAAEVRLEVLRVARLDLGRERLREAPPEALDLGAHERLHGRDVLADALLTLGHTRLGVLEIGLQRLEAAPQIGGLHRERLALDLDARPQGADGADPGVDR